MSHILKLAFVLLIIAVIVVHCTRDNKKDNIIISTSKVIKDNADKVDSIFNETRECKTDTMTTIK